MGARPCGVGSARAAGPAGVCDRLVHGGTIRRRPSFFRGVCAEAQCRRPELSVQGIPHSLIVVLLTFSRSSPPRTWRAPSASAIVGRELTWSPSVRSITRCPSHLISWVHRGPLDTRWSSGDGTERSSSPVKEARCAEYRDWSSLCGARRAGEGLQDGLPLPQSARRAAQARDPRGVERSANGFIFFGRGGEVASNRLDDDQEASVLMRSGRRCVSSPAGVLGKGRAGPPDGLATPDQAFSGIAGRVKEVPLGCALPGSTAKERARHGVRCPILMHSATRTPCGVDRTAVIAAARRDSIRLPSLGAASQGEPLPLHATSIDILRVCQ